MLVRGDLRGSELSSMMGLYDANVLGMLHANLWGQLWKCRFHLK